MKAEQGGEWACLLRSSVCPRPPLSQPTTSLRFFFFCRPPRRGHLHHWPPPGRPGRRRRRPARRRRRLRHRLPGRRPRSERHGRLGGGRGGPGRRGHRHPRQLRGRQFPGEGDRSRAKDSPGVGRKRRRGGRARGRGRVVAVRGLPLSPGISTPPPPPFPPLSSPQGRRRRPVPQRLPHRHGHRRGRHLLPLPGRGGRPVPGRPGPVKHAGHARQAFGQDEGDTVAVGGGGGRAGRARGGRARRGGRPLQRRDVAIARPHRGAGLGFDAVPLRLGDGTPRGRVVGPGRPDEGGEGGDGTGLEKKWERERRTNGEGKRGGWRVSVRSFFSLFFLALLTTSAAAAAKSEGGPAAWAAVRAASRAD